jgi:2-keto-4-pentenoate hydratase/2-oxohepta-3-ene-1,7-dioic acid hydratase in catechol pathway
MSLEVLYYLQKKFVWRSALVNNQPITERIARFLRHGHECEGIVDEDQIVGILPHRDLARIPVGKLDMVRLLPPCIPHTIVAIGRNYAEHVAEMKSELPQEPLLFLKPVTSLIASGEPIIYPSWSSQHVEFEGELAVIIGKPCYRVNEADAMSYILGYSCANDITARDLQRRDGQWARGKGFDTFCPIGPVLATNIDPSNLGLITRVNGEIKQDARTSDLIFKIPRIISHISATMTLYPGDVILTGSPAGVGPIQPGDIIEVEIENIGILRNHVIAGS